MPVNPNIARDIAAHFNERSFGKGELFLKEGQVSNEYLFLESGCMRSFLYDTEGNEVTMNFFTAQQPVFEVASFFQQIPAEEYLEAVTQSNGSVISYDKLNYLFHAIPEFREIGRALLVKGFIQFKKRTLSLINKTADERYKELMRTNPEVFQYASLKHIASYLGVTDTSLSRIRREFLNK
ncbi:Crp/Fnr family transcriptional regulator [Pontibacter saemangeumensis]|uniref:Crp/Fnr family transcriptional regulator n=2 Tax=Pontibacter saemangeumensis TaxID=1084525 RepID=A0ABP8LTT1_9BACT